MPNQTGPTSPAGQAVSCLNGLLHGTASRKLFIPGEDPNDFFLLLESCFEDFKPGSLNTAAVSDIAIARWHIWRRQRSSAANENALFEAQPDEAQWTEADLHRLSLFDRYQTQAQRTFHRAVQDLQAIQKQAASEQRWRDHFALQKQRFDLEAERFKLAQDRAKPSPAAAPEPAAKTYPMTEEAQRAGMRTTKEERDTLALSVGRLTPRPSCACSSEAIRRATAFANEPAELPVETMNGQRVVRQTITVSTIDGNVVTKFRPSNDALADFCVRADANYKLAQRDGETSVPPPPDVCRLFVFDGPVPVEYRWLLPDHANPELPNIKVIAQISPDVWWQVFVAEGDYPSQALCHTALPQKVKKAA